MLSEVQELNLENMIKLWDKTQTGNLWRMFLCDHFVHVEFI